MADTSKISRTIFTEYILWCNVQSIHVSNIVWRQCDGVKNVRLYIYIYAAMRCAALVDGVISFPALYPHYGDREIKKKEKKKKINVRIYHRITYQWKLCIV